MNAAKCFVCYTECKKVYKLTNDPIPPKKPHSWNLVFYDESGWYNCKGRQVHIVESSIFFPNYCNDRHILSDKRDFLEMIQFLDYATSVQSRIIITRIERQPGAFNTNYNDNLGPGLNIQLDSSNVNQLSFMPITVIQKIVDLKNEIIRLFDEGLGKKDCNCSLFLSPRYFGPCLLTIVNLNDPSIKCQGCSHNINLKLCCMERNYIKRIFSTHKEIKRNDECSCLPYKKPKLA